MKRIALAILALVAVPAFATTTWSAITGTTYSKQAACTTGTESAPTAATDGADLSAGSLGEASFEVYVCLTAGSGTISDGDGFDVYFYDPLVGHWAKYNATPYKVSTGALCGYVQFDAPTKGFPLIAKRGRVAVVPNAADAGLTIQILVQDSRGAVL